jgi:hypothetical protein
MHSFLVKIIIDWVVKRMTCKQNWVFFVDNFLLDLVILFVISSILDPFPMWGNQGSYINPISF